jgi:cytochrome P450
VPIPTAVTLEWLGFEDPDEWWKIGDAWHNLFSRSRTGPHFQRAGETIAWFDTRIAEELEARRENPRDDVLTHVLAIEINGEPLSQEDAVGLVRILIGAGTDTTTTLLGSAFVHLHFNPADRRRLVDEPDLMESATEEFLRRYPPTRTLYRTCVQDTDVDGFTIKAGEQVLASILAANLADDKFEDPVAFVPDRAPNRHLSFGMGVHKCLGMHLARAEFIHIMKAVLDRMPDFALVEDEISDYVTQATMMGWRTVPATFTPATKQLRDDEATRLLPLSA